MEKKCQRCQKEFTCNAQKIENCDCNKIKLSNSTLAYISQHYNDCLCLDCLTQLNQSSEVFLPLTHNSQKK